MVAPSAVQFVQDFSHQTPRSRLRILFIHRVITNNWLLIIDLAGFVILRLKVCTWQAVCSSHAVRFFAPRIARDWPEAALSGDRTGPNPARGSLSASRAALRCNRIQLDAIGNRANQPGFLFWDSGLGAWASGSANSLNAMLTPRTGPEVCGSRFAVPKARQTT